MSVSGSVDSSGYQGRVLRFEWGTNSISAERNVRNIWYKVTAVGGSSSKYYHHNDTVDINNINVYSGSDNHAVTTGDVLANGNIDIDQNVTTILSVHLYGGIYVKTDNIDTTKNWDLDIIPRYAKFTSHSISAIGLNDIVVNWNADSNCDAVQYSLNSSNWIVTSGTSYTINGLNPNTSYSIKTRIRRADSGLWTESRTITGTTKDIAKISDIDSFEHGSSAIINITNPSNSSLNLVMKIGDTQILSKNINSGTNVINFSDTELDIIYKLYGNSNSLIAAFTVTTANKYTNSKTCKIILKGNQKTSFLKINDSIKRAQIFVCVNGQIKRAVLWICQNGKIKRCV